jgi:F-box-like
MDSMIESYTAQDEEIAERQRILIQELEETEDQRKKIRDTIAYAQASKRALESAASRLEGHFSPIRRLPVELLCQIFYMLLLEEENTRRSRMERWKCSMTTRTCAPVVLGRVCSQWRAIVHQNPRLWEGIVIQRVSLHSLGREDEAQEAIDRISQYRALGIQTNQSIVVESWGAYGPDVLLSLLGYHTIPWKSIEIAVASDSPGQWDIDVLRATNVRLFRAQTKQALETFEPLLRHATSIYITGMPPVWGSDPWTSLTSLEIRPWVTLSGETEETLPFGAAHLIQLLNSAPNLEELVLAFPTADGSPHTHHKIGQSLVHDSIKSLSLHLHHLERNLSLFGVHVSGPSLRHLTVLSFDCYCHCQSDISVGWEQLTSLSLGNMAERAQFLWAFRFLRRVPTVETLEIQGTNINRLFTLMHRIGTPHQLAQLPLPRLTKLIMRETDIKGRTLIEWLEGRLARLEGDIVSHREVTDIDSFENPGVLRQDWERVKNLLDTGRSCNASRVGSAT